MKRSDFLKSGGMLITCACGAPFIYGCKAITGNSDTPLLSENNYKINKDFLILDLEKIQEFKQVGGSVKIELKDPDLKLIVARTGVDEFVALRDRCSHGGRELEFFTERSIFRCVSFGHSRFDSEGMVIKGPAKTMLKRYHTILKEKELKISIG